MNSTQEQVIVRLSLPYFGAKDATLKDVSVTPQYATKDFFVTAFSDVHKIHNDDMFPCFSVYHKPTGFWLANYASIETCKGFISDLEALGDWSTINSHEAARASGFGQSFKELRDKWRAHELGELV
jgi:hypothetical protein